MCDNGLDYPIEYEYQLNMTKLDIIRPDNPILRKKAKRVSSFDKKLQTLIDNMVETMIEAPGVGLAAPQVAVSQRLLVARLQDDEKSKEEFGKCLIVSTNKK